ncbi:uncharacterized protein Fot_11048 [Forsythia ovata]|uniref:Nuclear receptor corepressor 1 n=1 Tax=Forsythia ovata TaxID=205694 RepID=A0ABD1WLA2_9LAMI
MPPEPLPPWERRDFRKHDARLGGGYGGGGGGPPRWRDQNHPHPPPPHLLPSHPYHHHQRWYSDFRSRPLPPGHGKQGSWHMYSEESHHGVLPFGSRFSDRNLDDGIYRPFGSRGDGRYFRNSRENRGSGSQKRKSNSSEPASSSTVPSRPTNDVNNQKSEENMQTYSSNNSNNNSRSLPDCVTSLDKTPFLMKDQCDKKGDNVVISMFQNVEKDRSLVSIDWKPLKWTRSGSFSSRGSGFSHSSSSKSMGADSNETVAEVQLKNVMSVQSPSGAAATACVASTTPALSEETSLTKKRRLGWGEGLAKYEKKKVEGPEDFATKNGLVVSVNNAELLQSLSTNLVDNSPRAACLSDCVSHATPSSIACSSSPGIEERQSIKAASVDQDSTNLNHSPRIVSQTLSEGSIFNLENLETTSIANLSSLINDLLQSDDRSSVDTDFVQTTAMNNLLAWKVNILKAVEMTETEIDLLETELKSLISAPRNNCPYPNASSSLPEECHFEACGDQVAVSCGDVIVENTPIVLEDEHAELKDEDMDGPDSATSKLVEVPSFVEDVSLSNTEELIEGFRNSDANNSRYLEVKCLENRLKDEKIAGRADDSGTIMGSRYPTFSSGGNLYCGREELYNLILASNKDSANRASEVLNMLLPNNQCQYDVSTAASVSYLQSDPIIVKKKFLMRKRFLQFKEKVISLKYKVLEHMWKEDLFVCARKTPHKSHKKLYTRRYRSSSRSQSSPLAENMCLVPTEDLIDFARTLLSDSQVKIYRSTLNMPALILDKKEKMVSRFISTNGLVEDPCAVEKERSMINPWTSEERKIFMDKLASFGKDFRKIASFLNHKTTAECVEFYYKNHKLDCFEKAPKKPNFLKQRKSQPTSTYLLASRKRWNREGNAASLDILGSASAIADNVDYGLEIQQRCTSTFFSGASSDHNEPRDDDVSLARSKSLDVFHNERETLAADVLASICGSLSSEAMSSCITSSVDLGEDYQDWRCQRVGSSIKCSFTPEVTQNVDDESSDESCGEMDHTAWTDEEKALLIQAVLSYGKDFTMISRCVRSRSRDQCKVFYSKARNILGLDLIQPGLCNAMPCDVNGGGSDTEDACDVETGSVDCSERSECKMEDDFPSPDVKSSRESNTVGTLSLKPDLDKCEDNSGTSFLDMDSGPVLENSMPDGCQVDDMPKLDTNGQNGASSSCVHVQDHVTAVISSDVEFTPVVEEADSGLPNGSSEDEYTALVNVSDGYCRAGNKGQELLLPKESSDGGEVENGHGSPNEVSGLSCSTRDVTLEHQLVAGNASHVSADAHSSTQLDILSVRKKKADLDDHSADKSRVNSLQQKDHVVTVKVSPQFSAPTKYQKISNHNISLAVDANGINDKQCRKIVRTGELQQNLSGQSLSDHGKSSQILSGYPVSMSTLKEINREIDCKSPVSLQSVPMSDGNFYSDRHLDFSLQKCNGSRHQSSIAESLIPSQERTRMDYSRPHSASSLIVEKPCRNGDVKLFGKILISEKSNSGMQRTVDNNIHHHKEGSQSLNPKWGGDQRFKFDSAQPKFDCSNYLGSENIPVMNFGFWDVNRMQTGFPLPDSALLLAKYPAAISNYAMSTAKLELSELSSSNGVADYQVLRSRRQVQPFTIDMKQPQDVLISEMQRRNGFDVFISGMQKQARGMVGTNAVGSGALVGGQWNGGGISDPVAAIKMHYAKAEQFGAQTGNIIIRENDLWRNERDLGS